MTTTPLSTYILCYSLASLVMIVNFMATLIAQDFTYNKPTVLAAHLVYRTALIIQGICSAFMFVGLIALFLKWWG